MDEQEQRKHKMQFGWALRPFFEMLIHKRNDLSQDDWVISIRTLEQSIIRNPEQYLGRDLPDANFIFVSIKEIVDDFLEEQLNLVE